MKKVVLYSPGLSSMNLGDKIIAESAKEGIDYILNESFTTEVATHLPQSFYYMRYLKNADLKFVLGSNLLKSTFFGFKRQWDVTLRMAKITGPVILMGVGWWQYGNKPNLYTRLLLKSILSKNHVHSVRDEYTEKVLKSIGINNVINTACPTMWKLTEEHCREIKQGKSDNVVFTITDYNRDIEKDNLLIDILAKNYKIVYFWPQGVSDYEYFMSLEQKHKNIEILSPSLDAYNKTLEKGNIDYIGTRLHGGIRALQKKARTIIISIDNRAREKSKSFNLPIIERDNIQGLNEMINSQLATEIKIPIENINRWRKQFED
ncbi:polysaccharide pyruvyl transferase family protein [Bacillus timonensis]|uniref:Polysaccharide pyruvyl transferase family protein n=1 Tax=Bacillus timonensis TaxID=1033734 RepID=A0A4S3PJ40_9BACI|nr:polysaccharide pyruvyl transferase family protein [Bacillus timonensis]THE09064.1 polysaccharide pyruvyl transferase family protein [Bacillus timonensis]